MKDYKAWTSLDCERIHNQLIDWMYQKRYGNGESPATERQINLIERLGGNAPLGMNKKQASNLIVKLKEQTRYTNTEQAQN